MHTQLSRHYRLSWLKLYCLVTALFSILYLWFMARFFKLDWAWLTLTQSVHPHIRRLSLSLDILPFATSLRKLQCGGKQASCDEKTIVSMFWHTSYVHLSYSRRLRASSSPVFATLQWISKTYLLGVRCPYLATQLVLYQKFVAAHRLLGYQQVFDDEKSSHIQQ